MRHIHFIGIGGAGMSGLAEIAIAQGNRVSGSDIAANGKTSQLEKLGANIFIGHREQNVLPSVDTVVHTSAISVTNPELIEAKRRKITTVRRAEFLGMLTDGLQTIAVAGTHGKTTTTSMIAHVLIKAGLDPLVSVGASVKELKGSNARAGKGNVAVVEADEYDRSFLALKPFVAVLTTLEAEHLDIYKDISDLEETFAEFANKSNSSHEHGFVVVNIDEPSLRRTLPKLTKRIVSFGITSLEAKYRAENVHIDGFRTTAIIYRGNEQIGELVLQCAGSHNVKNALATIAVADILAIPFELTSSALAKFKGAERRLDLVGEKNGVLVIDDYAHHPTEIRATLSTLREGFPGRRIIAAFQPHTFTRTRDFADEFGNAFAEYADELYLLDIYPAREEPIPGVTSNLIQKAAAKAGLKKITPIKDLKLLASSLAKGRSKGDIIITLGAGSITESTPLILRNLH